MVIKKSINPSFSPLVESFLNQFLGRKSHEFSIVKVYAYYQITLYYNFTVSRSDRGLITFSVRLIYAALVNSGERQDR